MRAALGQLLLGGGLVMEAALFLRNLTLGYNRHPAVHHLSARFAAGSLTALVGPNGAGKSTLLKGIAGALKPLEGRISGRVDAGHDVAFLPQRPEVDWSFPMAVEDLVAMGLWREAGPFGGLSAARRGRVERAIATVGLSGFERRSIGSLSGGQMRRVLFARLLLRDARLILLDEPFTAIDARTAADLMGVIQRWRAAGRTVIAALHDMESVRAHFPQTLLLARELVEHGPTARVLTAGNLARARRMCEAFDASADVCDQSAA